MEGETTRLKKISLFLDFHMHQITSKNLPVTEIGNVRSWSHLKWPTTFQSFLQQKVVKKCFRSFVTEKTQDRNGNSIGLKIGMCWNNVMKDSPNTCFNFWGKMSLRQAFPKGWSCIRRRTRTLLTQLSLNPKRIRTFDREFLSCHKPIKLHHLPWDY